MERIRVGLIGVSGYAKTHLEAIDYCCKKGICELAAVVIKPDTDYSSYAGMFRSRDIRVYRGYEEMFSAESGKIDIIGIPTGIGFHKEHAVAALDSGFHALCEKPAAGTIAEAMEMKAARDRSKKILAIGYQYLVSPAIRAIKEYSVSRKLGRVLFVRTFASGMRDAAYYTRNDWAGKIGCNGKMYYDSPMQNAFAHYLMNMLYVSSDQENASARIRSVLMENYRAKPIECADTQSLSIETGESVPVYFVATHACEHNESFMEVVYQGGRVEWTPQKTSVYETRQTGELLLAAIENNGVPNNIRIYEDTIEAILGLHEPAATIENAMQQTIAIELGFRSSAGAYQIPSGFVVSSEATGYGAVIRDIVPVMKSAFSARKNFSALGIPWAKESTLIYA